MRTDGQVKDSVQRGECRVLDAQLEVLLDIRMLLQEIRKDGADRGLTMFDAVSRVEKLLVAKKPGRRKK